MRRVAFLLMFFAVYSHDQNLSAQIEIDSLNRTVVKSLNKLDTEIDSLGKELVKVNSRYEYQVRLNEQTLNSISTQIDSASFNLTIFGILFGVIAIFLGLYVTYIERKIVKIRVENEAVLSQTISVREEVVQINQKIQDDIYGLFLKIKREETVHILNRLGKVPEDISNLSTDLLSRNLEREDFELLKNAYLQIVDNQDDSYAYSYKLLFFQHFLDLALKDDAIAEDMKGSFVDSIINSFRNDIIKSTENFMKAIIDLDYQKKSDEINEFFEGLSASEHKDNELVYTIMINSLVSRDDQFKFLTLVNDDEGKEHAKLRYGEALLKRYENDVLTKSEENVKEQVAQISKELRNEK